MKKVVLAVIGVLSMVSIAYAGITSISPHGTLNSGAKCQTGLSSPVALGSGTSKRIIVKAQLSNTGNICVGDSSHICKPGKAGATTDNDTGVELDAGEVWIGTLDNIADVYVTGTVTGECVSFTYENQLGVNNEKNNLYSYCIGYGYACLC